MSLLRPFFWNIHVSFFEGSDLRLFFFRGSFQALPVYYFFPFGIVLCFFPEQWLLCRLHIWTSSCFAGVVDRLRERLLKSKGSKRPPCGTSLFRFLHRRYQCLVGPRNVGLLVYLWMFLCFGVIRLGFHFWQNLALVDSVMSSKEIYENNAGDQVFVVAFFCVLNEVECLTSCANLGQKPACSWISVGSNIGVNLWSKGLSYNLRMLGSEISREFPGWLVSLPGLAFAITLAFFQDFGICSISVHEDKKSVTHCSALGSAQFKCLLAQQRFHFSFSPWLLNLPFHIVLLPMRGSHR